MRYSSCAVFVALAVDCAVAFGCGGSPPPTLPELSSDPLGPQCAALNGTYSATFILKESEGSCDSAKKESHDPMEFGSDGQFKSPVEDIIECKSAQVGCQLAVRCTTQALLDASGSLDATVSEDGSELHGTGTLEGSYNDCHRLVYDVSAVRKTDAK